VGTNGTLTVTKDLSMSENWSGTVELQTGEIGDDFSYYFTVSEQTPSAVSVGVRIGTDGNVESAGGLLLQVLPDATEEDIRICEHVLEGLKPMSQLIQEYDDVNLDQLILDMFEDAKILETRDIRFFCGCSKEKSAQVLATLPKEEVQALLGNPEGTDITCNFCNETYHFDKEDIENVLENMND
jgi:molecular chaperone Hsp33